MSFIGDEYVRIFEYFVPNIYSNIVCFKILSEYTHIFVRLKIHMNVTLWLFQYTGFFQPWQFYLASVLLTLNIGAELA